MLPPTVDEASFLIIHVYLRPASIDVVGNLSKPFGSDLGAAEPLVSSIPLCARARTDQYSLIMVADSEARDDAARPQCM